MSEEHHKLLYKEINGDSGLLEKLNADPSPDGKIAIADFVSIAKQAGFLSMDSDLAAKDSLNDHPSGALADGEVVSVTVSIALNVLALIGLFDPALIANAV